MPKKWCQKNSILRVFSFFKMKTQFFHFLKFQPILLVNLMKNKNFGANGAVFDKSAVLRLHIFCGLRESGQVFFFENRFRRPILVTVGFVFPAVFFESRYRYAFLVFLPCAAIYVFPTGNQFFAG